MSIHLGFSNEEFGRGRNQGTSIHQPCPGFGVLFSFPQLLTNSRFSLKPEDGLLGKVIIKFCHLSGFVRKDQSRESTDTPRPAHTCALATHAHTPFPLANNTVAMVPATIMGVLGDVALPQRANCRFSHCMSSLGLP